ncbi:MAG: phosphate signaling complex protein PhoU [Clostridium sp.]|nr:phosphate signaling complex protein PhoU [Clostridium sp.]MCM1172322.1 phosphate signaling complex protein PhoU [Clostridium sp.]MCM1209687.1 phosphate signaling complex protein PhoU [Ruminococcus sp.]
MRSHFDEQLATLNNELTQMGAMCEEAISVASMALTTGNVKLTGKVLSLDGEIGQMERRIETLCLKLLLQQQPVARDLRQISAALKMITDMERIGTQAADIAEIITFLDGRTGEECKHIRFMAEATIRMVTESIDAYVKQDVVLAAAAIDHDDVVDDLFLQVKASLIKLISEKPSDGGYALDLLMIAKYFERIGDHAVNIAEWVAFSVTGVHKGEGI